LARPGTAADNETISRSRVRTRVGMLAIEAKAARKALELRSAGLAK
jgi:hypothetical protein